MTKTCDICGNRIRKGIVLKLTEFNNSEVDEIEYILCPKDSPVTAEIFLQEVKNRVG